MNKEQVLQDNIARTLTLAQIYRYTLQSVAKSEAIAELARKARENKVKNWPDLRKAAADGIRSTDALVLKIKGAKIGQDTWREIVRFMNSEIIHEVSLIIDQLVKIEDMAKLEQLKEYIENYKNAQ